MQWQKISNVTPSLKHLFIMIIRGTPYFAKRFLYEGQDLIVFCASYSSIRPDDPVTLMRYNVPRDLAEFKADDSILWGYFDMPR